MPDDIVPAGKQPLLSNKAYDIWKLIAQIILPGLGTLYFTLSSIIHVPYPEQVVGSITAVDVFLGLVLAQASKMYVDIAQKSQSMPFDGTLVINLTDPEKDTYSLEFDVPLYDLTDKTETLLRVDATK